MLLPGQELLQIISQQDQQASEPATPSDAAQTAHDSSSLSGLPDQAQAEGEVQESLAPTGAHLVGEADGAPTDGQDEELRDALAAETQHMVRRAPFYK